MGPGVGRVPAPSLSSVSHSSTFPVSGQTFRRPVEAEASLTAHSGFLPALLAQAGGWGEGALTRRVGDLERVWLQAFCSVWQTVFTRKEQKAGAVLAVWPDLLATGLDGVWSPMRPVRSGTYMSAGDCHPWKPRLVASGVSQVLLCAGPRCDRTQSHQFRSLSR